MIPLTRTSYFAFLCALAPWRELLFSQHRFHAKTQRRKGSQRQNRNSLFANVAKAALLVIFAASLTAGQSPVRDYRRAHERQILAEFTRLLSIPNVASDRINVRRSAQFIFQMMQRRGLNPRLLETKSKES